MSVLYTSAPVCVIYKLRYRKQEAYDHMAHKSFSDDTVVRKEAEREARRREKRQL